MQCVILTLRQNFIPSPLSHMTERGNHVNHRISQDFLLTYYFLFLLEDNQTSRKAMIRWRVCKCCLPALADCNCRAATMTSWLTHFISCSCSCGSKKTRGYRTKCFQIHYHCKQLIITFFPLAHKVQFSSSALEQATRGPRLNTEAERKQTEKHLTGHGASASGETQADKFLIGVCVSLTLLRVSDENLYHEPACLVF